MKKCKLLREDYLFSLGNLQRLWMLLKYCNDKIVGKFIYYIFFYLTKRYTNIGLICNPELNQHQWRLNFMPFPEYISSLEEPHLRQWRAMLILYLENIDKVYKNDTEISEKAIERLDLIVEQMQMDYCRITEEYLILKRNLMS
jgi:hypothetical protein